MKDGYRDDLRMFISGERLRSLYVEVLDSDGQQVRRTLGPTTKGPAGVSARFTGKVGGKMLPEGDYTWRVSATDEHGNSTVIDRPFSLSHKQIRSEKFTRTYEAASTVVDTNVGRCSTLKKRPRGGLGYYSQTSCSRPEDSTVLTVNGVYVPKSFNGSWDNLRVTTNGGGATGRRDYLVVFNRDRHGNDEFRTVHRGGSGRHRNPLHHREGEAVRAPRQGGSGPALRPVGGRAHRRQPLRRGQLHRGDHPHGPQLSRSMSRTASEANTIAEPSGAPGPG